MGLNNQPIFQIIHDSFVNAKLSYVNCYATDWMFVRRQENSDKPALTHLHLVPHICVDELGQH